VHRSGSTAYAEVLETVEPGEVEAVKLKLHLEKLDQEWMEENERHGSVRTLQLVVFIMWLAMIAGLLLVMFGAAVDMKHLGGPVPGPVPYVCMIFGAMLVVGWIVFFIFGRSYRYRIGAYYHAKQSYEYRRQKLLQDIAASKERMPTDSWSWVWSEIRVMVANLARCQDHPRFPRIVSILGARNLNQVLQEAMNSSTGGPEVQRFGWTFRIGDRIIQTENDYDKDVFNGDLGVVESINRVEQDVTVSFEGRAVEYDFGDLDELSLA
jgi:hypothetical protein